MFNNVVSVDVHNFSVTIGCGAQWGQIYEEVEVCFFIGKICVRESSQN